MRVLLAGGEVRSLVSEAGSALLPFFSMADACALRQVCQELRAVVREFAWWDKETVIKGSIAAWRASFPRARCANVHSVGPQGRRAPLHDADFVHFEGLRELSVAGRGDFTGAAFAHLRGIHTLCMLNCSQLTVAAAAFEPLRGIALLDVRWCSAATVAGAQGLAQQGTVIMRGGK